MTSPPDRPVLLTRAFWLMMALAAASLVAAAVVASLGPRLFGPRPPPVNPLARPWRADQGALRDHRPMGRLSSAGRAAHS